MSEFLAGVWKSSQTHGEADEEAQEQTLAKESPSVIQGILPKLFDTARIEEESSSDEWSVLSDRVSASSVGGGVIVVDRASSSKNLLLAQPIKVKRTHSSSSTIDSSTSTLDDIDYVEHVVLPTDTLQGLCLAYQTTATKIRQTNHFSGNSLWMAPKKLKIPCSSSKQIQDLESTEYKIAAFRADCPDMSLQEAKSYLEEYDWNLTEAICAANQDGEWQQHEAAAAADDDKEEQVVVDSNSTTTKQQSLSIRELRTSVGKMWNLKPKRKFVLYQSNNIPAIATNAMTLQDEYNAAPQHDSAGVEMKPLPRSIE